MAASFGRVAAGQPDQLLLDIPFDLDLVRAGRLRLVIQGSVAALGDKPLANAGDGSWTNPQSGDKVIIGLDRSWGNVGQQ